MVIFTDAVRTLTARFMNADPLPTTARWLANTFLITDLFINPAVIKHKHLSRTSIVDELTRRVNDRFNDHLGLQNLDKSPRRQTKLKDFTKMTFCPSFTVRIVIFDLGWNNHMFAV